MSADKPSLIFRFTKFVVKRVYKPFEAVFEAPLPEEACVIVGNHSQLHGPLGMELYAPRRCFIWCVYQMMSFKEVPDYTYADFWGRKPRSVRWIFRIVSYLIAPLCVMLFNNARIIPVYHDNRLLSTVKDSIKRLDEGADVVIFPEKDVEYNGLLYQFQDGFVELAMFYKRKTGKDLKFVPVYICPELKQFHYGEATTFDSSKPAKEECARVKQYLMDEITKIARSLPRHRVVPYRNMPKKDYPYNK